MTSKSFRAQQMVKESVIVCTIWRSTGELIPPTLIQCNIYLAEHVRADDEPVGKCPSFLR